jgi:hypothetical protein
MCEIKRYVRHWIGIGAASDANDFEMEHDIYRGMRTWRGEIDGDVIISLNAQMHHPCARAALPQGRAIQLQAVHGNVYRVAPRLVATARLSDDDRDRSFMVIAVGSSPFANSSAGSSVPALESRVRQDQAQLNDWRTCVSAKTPKGQAAIQKLSGEVSATKEAIARALQFESGGRSSAQASPAGTGRSGSDPSSSWSVDLWV